MQQAGAVVNEYGKGSYRTQNNECLLEPNADWTSGCRRLEWRNGALHLLWPRTRRQFPADRSSTVTQVTLPPGDVKCCLPARVARGHWRRRVPKAAG